ncbi:uncharacterized protein LOC129605560 [Condylostylus longicornis]|uniref:uncharacterized protein LOC129605560 n=1 Tax=Condylostylus longicornis TaxID=2530218 RepID=UPI00244E4D90|nr:uncharacterized protein LOC129605560 [Condylostylus longicornis]XP_055371370.1 uncharacterized protein LOC129605560 [Condylostylus longicornis]XP_055371371.1 uncharacterized protein LOC129605560 [Condylostylus longicornis]
MKNSRVWNHFNMVDKNKTQCIHCRKYISKNGGTSNLKKHLSRKHQEYCIDLDVRNPKKIFDHYQMLEDLALDLNFDDEKIKQFICVIQMNSILYSKTNEKELTDYEKQSCKTIWEEIANEFEIHESDCRRIWSILHKQYSSYIRTRDPEKCKYINELAFLDEYLQRNRIEKVPMKDTETLYKNYNLPGESKKVLISVPDISDTPIHEISVNKTELLDDDNSAEDYEVLYEEFDPILVKNQTLDNPVEECKNETIFHEKSEWNNYKSKRYVSERNQQSYQRQKHFNRYQHQDEGNKINQNLPKDRYNPNIKTENKNHNLYKNRNICSSPKRMKKSTDDMDEIDFFFEFLHRKLRKMSSDLCRQLQMKFMETIQEAEQRSRKHTDRSVDTADPFE